MLWVKVKVGQKWDEDGYDFHNLQAAFYSFGFSVF